MQHVIAAVVSMRWPRSFAVALSVLFCSGCISVTDRNLLANASFPIDGGKSVVIVGVKPNWGLQAIRGNDTADGWRENLNAGASLNSGPRGGYVVVTMPPSTNGESYGFARQISPNGDLLRLCTGHRVVTFKIPGSTVIYIGDIAIAETPQGLQFTLSYNFEAAQRFMQANQPALAGKLVPGTMSVAVAARGECAVSYSPLAGLIESATTKAPTVIDMRR